MDLHCFNFLGYLYKYIRNIEPWCLSLQEPKKMLRYLDGRVVSTKGERFTEIKKEDSDEMKKTYVNLKPARKYRFH